MTVTPVRTAEPTMKTTTSEAEADHGLLDGEPIEFAAGIPGFPACRRFRLEHLAPELAPFCRMRSVEEPEIGFVVVAPGALFADYTVEIDEQHVVSLGLDSADDALVMVVVTLGDPPTANLLGPIVVNRRTRAAAQVVQYQASYRAAEPLTSRSED